MRDVQSCRKLTLGNSGVFSQLAKFGTKRRVFGRVHRLFHCSNYRSTLLCSQIRYRPISADLRRSAGGSKRSVRAPSLRQGAFCRSRAAHARLVAKERLQCVVRAELTQYVVRAALEDSNTQAIGMGIFVPNARTKQKGYGPAIFVGSKVILRKWAVPARLIQLVVANHVNTKSSNECLWLVHAKAFGIGCPRSPVASRFIVSERKPW